MVVDGYATLQWDFEVNGLETVGSQQMSVIVDFASRASAPSMTRCFGGRTAYTDDGFLQTTN